MSPPGNKRPTVGLKIVGSPEQVAAFVPDPTVPATRGDCSGKESTCAHYKCPHNLTARAPVDRQGRRHAINQPQRNSWKIDLRRPHRCALLIVDQNPGGISPTRIAEIMGMTRRNAERLISLAMGKLELEAVRDRQVADELDADMRTRDARILSPRDDELPSMRMPQVDASVTVVVIIGERRVELTASPEVSRSLLAAMRNAPAGNVRTFANELRLALTEEAP